MALIPDWTAAVARQIVEEDFVGEQPQHRLVEQRERIEQRIVEIIWAHCPFKPDMAYEEVKPIVVKDQNEEV